MKRYLSQCGNQLALGLWALLAVLIGWVCPEDAVLIGFVLSATNAFETSLLGLIITNANASNVGDATGLRGSTTAGVFWISLHTASPGEAGDQTTNETAYTNYARQDEARNTTQWTVTNNTADNDNAIGFPTGGASGSTVTDFGLGSDTSGAGNLFLFGSLAASLAVSSGITPSFAAGALDITLD